MSEELTALMAKIAAAISDKTAVADAIALIEAEIAA